jgi:hypothetical protein
VRWRVEQLGLGAASKWGQQGHNVNGYVRLFGVV